MKKYFLIVLLYGCCTSCNLSSTDDDKKETDSTSRQTTELNEQRPSDAELASRKDSIATKDAKKKMKDIKKLNFKDFDVAWTEYSVSELKNIFCWDARNIERVRFFLGAFDTTITVNSKPKTITVPVIMMQLRRGTEGGMVPVYEYSYYRGKTVCPPPEPCYQIEEEK